MVRTLQQQKGWWKKTSSSSACSRYRLSLRRSTVIREEPCERVCVCVCIIFCYCASVFFLLVFFSNRKEKLKSASYKQTKSLENLSKNNRCLAFRCHFLLFSFVSTFFFYFAVPPPPLLRRALLLATASSSPSPSHFVACVCVCDSIFLSVCVCALKFIVEYVLIFCFPPISSSVCLYVPTF